jgi:hypothetical protein
MSGADTLLPGSLALAWQPVLLGRDAFLGRLRDLLARPDLRAEASLDSLGLDAVERHVLLVELARHGAVVDETAAWALHTLDDLYERYALAVVDVP